MFKFLSRAISPNSVFSQNPCQWLSTKGTSFTTSYLIDTCGFSTNRAESLSQCMSFETSEKPETVIDFFNNLGLPETKVLSIIRSIPVLPGTNPNKHLRQKVDFFKSKGFSNSEIRSIICKYPGILKRSLQKEIIPCFEFFNRMLQSQHKVMKTVVRYSGILCDLARFSLLNIQALRDGGVPESLVVRFIEYYPRTLKLPPKKFKELVQEVKDLGFNPLKMQFIVVVHIKAGLSRSTWARKESIYRKWGWSDDVIFAAFRVQPFVMSISESKIDAVMDFLVNKLGFVASDIARCPVVLCMSLGKRIVPRGSVFLVLKSKGLVGQVSLNALFKSDEKIFLDKFVSCHEKESYKLLKLYKDKLILEE